MDFILDVKEGKRERKVSTKRDEVNNTSFSFTGEITKDLKKAKEYADLYFIDEDKQYVKLKIGVAGKHVNVLKKAIEQSTETIEMMNQVNQLLLGQARERLDNITDSKDLSEVSTLIGQMIANQQTLMSLAKETPKTVESLLNIERNILQEQKDYRTLDGKRAKGYNEDKEDYKVEDSIEEITLKQIQKKNDNGTLY